MAEKKLSKKALNKSFRNWFYGHLTCFSQEHMQTFGYLCAMLPLVEELYDTKEEQTEALKTYSAFFNTEPQLGTVIVGMTAGLEEAKANGEDIDGEMINGIRAGLMARSPVSATACWSARSSRSCWALRSVCPRAVRRSARSSTSSRTTLS